MFLFKAIKNNISIVYLAYSFRMLDTAQFNAIFDFFSTIAYKDIVYVFIVREWSSSIQLVGILNQILGLENVYIIRKITKALNSIPCILSLSLSLYQILLRSSMLVETMLRSRDLPRPQSYHLI